MRQTDRKNQSRLKAFSLGPWLEGDADYTTSWRCRFGHCLWRSVESFVILMSGMQIKMNSVTRTP